MIEKKLPTDFPEDIHESVMRGIKLRFMNLGMEMGMITRFTMLNAGLFPDTIPLFYFNGYKNLNSWLN